MKIISFKDAILKKLLVGALALAFFPYNAKADANIKTFCNEGGQGTLECSDVVIDSLAYINTEKFIEWREYAYTYHEGDEAADIRAAERITKVYAVDCKEQKTALLMMGDEQDLSGKYYPVETIQEKILVDWVCSHKNLPDDFEGGKGSED